MGDGKFKVTERFAGGWTDYRGVFFKAHTYDKAFNKETQDWCIVANALMDFKIVKGGLTEAEADAWLKLLKEG